MVTAPVRFWGGRARVVKGSQRSCATSRPPHSSLFSREKNSLPFTATERELKLPPLCLSWIMQHVRNRTMSNASDSAPADCLWYTRKSDIHSPSFHRQSKACFHEHTWESFPTVLQRLLFCPTSHCSPMFPHQQQHQVLCTVDAEMETLPLF